MLNQRQIKNLTTDLGGKIETVDYSVIDTSLKGSISLLSGNIDWSRGAVFNLSLGGNTTIVYSNLALNKTITLIISGNYALLFSSNTHIISGEYDPSTTNYIQLHCVDTATPSVWGVISQEAS